MLRELDHSPLEIVEVDLAETARFVVAGLGASDRVVFDIPEGTVATDRDLVVEAFRDLLVHALAKVPDGSTVTICADSEKSGLRLWVDDHGAGIDAADQTALVERLQRFERSAARPHGGPGLGLHLAAPAA
jgi:signal transduction histidine kinase